MYHSLKKFLEKKFFQQNLEKTFTKIYRKHLWGGGNETVSGSGSTLYQTTHIRKKIPLLVKKFNIRTMIDAPCGDYRWMKKINLKLDKYIGVDIVKNLIKINQKKYECPNRKFIHMDITKDPLPKANLILCRDCFSHLPFKAIIAILKNFCKSRPKYLLLTTYNNCQKNEDMEPSACFRPLNLTLPPFDLPKPDEVIDEKFCGKSLALWDIESLIQSLNW